MASRRPAALQALSQYYDQDEGGNDGQSPPHSEDMEALRCLSPLEQADPDTQKSSSCDAQVVAATDISFVKLPSEPSESPHPKLQKTISDLAEKIKLGHSFNERLQMSKNFRNPNIYSKLIEYCGIKENGTNCPREIFDVNSFPACAYYDEIARLQEELYQRQTTSTRTQVAFESAKHSDVMKAQDLSKRSKWDQFPEQSVKRN